MPIFVEIGTNPSGCISRLLLAAKHMAGREEKARDFPLSEQKGIQFCLRNAGMEMSADQVGNLSVSATEIASAGARVVPGRACGTCTLCCKVVGVLEIAKPAGVWCPHCVSGKRCAIYDTRFASCRTFYCQWMIEKGLGPEWKPERAKFVLVKTEAGHHLSACVDPGYPSAWRRSPYYENLKQWAAEGVRRSPDLHLVDAMIGSHCIVILPDRDVDIGILAPDEMIKLEGKETGAGMVIEVRKVKC